HCEPGTGTVPGSVTKMFVDRHRAVTLGLYAQGDGSWSPSRRGGGPGDGRTRADAPRRVGVSIGRLDSASLCHRDGAVSGTARPDAEASAAAGSRPLAPRLSRPSRRGQDT